MSPDPDDLEQRLRESLHQEAARINPRERRAEILAMTQHKEETAEPHRRWLIPAAAAASVALIGAAVWGVSNSPGSQQATPAATSTSTTASTSAPSAPTGARSSAPTAAPAPATVPAPNVSPSATPNGKLAGTTLVSLPVYFVGGNTPTGNTFGLYREFVPTSVPAAASPAQKAKAAVAVALRSRPFTTVEPYLNPWAGTSVTNVTVTPGRITVTLKPPGGAGGPGASGSTAEQGKLAVQQLVWTAQAAVGHGNIPVKFDTTNGSTKMFGTYPTAQTYNRPAAAAQYQVLAPIWITSPVHHQVFPAGASVVAAGQSCAFEGTTAWQLTKGRTVVRSGSTLASSGCPTRGTWQVKLGALGSGSYTFRMYEMSMKDGSVLADTSSPFTVK